MLKKFIPLFLILSFLCLTSPVLASENNKFGIHITQTEDLNKAAELVNASGGDWGYVTIVIQDSDKNKEKWQKFFDLCREKHLIPLVRLAAHLTGDTWEKPTVDSINDWADFLDSLNWPIKNQYVIVFNEPNHTKEWGGKVSSEEYALILDKVLTTFKQKNPDFVVLNAGFDQAAADSPTTIEELRFLREMESKIPGILARVDGWVSHSYPNHGYVGKPWESGRATVRGYEWELAILKNNFGVTKDLPVFITETGWPHLLMENGRWKMGNFYKPETTAQFIKQTFEDVWLKDDKVVAITPFILNYPYYPFENFSWLDIEGNPYLQYEEVKDIKKLKGEPTQRQKYEVVDLSLPSFLPVNLGFKGKVTLKNTGQSIWGEKPFRLKSLARGLRLTDLTLAPNRKVIPGETAEFEFILETPNASGNYTVSWEDSPKYKLRFFEAWKLTSSQEALFNRIFKKILERWYSFRH